MSSLCAALTYDQGYQFYLENDHETTVIKNEKMRLEIYFYCNYNY